MRPLIQEIAFSGAPEVWIRTLEGLPGRVLLRSGLLDSPQARYSFVAAEPFLSFRSYGSRCELQFDRHTYVQFGNPWRLLDSLIARYELLDELDLPFPIGGCFGYWGFDLKQFVEPGLPRSAVDDLGLPDCHVGFYDSLIAIDHQLSKAWIISTGLTLDGTVSESKAAERLNRWRERVESPPPCTGHEPDPTPLPAQTRTIQSSLARADFIRAVEQAQSLIRTGHIYQVNLSHRLTTTWTGEPWDFFLRLASVSPAPFSAFVDCNDFQIASSSPELFLRLSGSHVLTRPIKGTRPRSADPVRDAQWMYELQTSPKEMAELVMITDLLRNDLGKVCEYGSVHVPELVRLERYPQVQHLVSTVEGRLRPDMTHLGALASCFPGGSVTGAPKIRAMEIIDELEPITRGPYTGAIGYLGFNRESQLSIAIRTAVLHHGQVHFHVGAGIVADSNPAAEYDETLAKAQGFLTALSIQHQPEFPAPPRRSYARIR